MEGKTLSPEPWTLHLLGLISPFLVISGNLLGGLFTAMGVIFIWGVGPILDVLLGKSKISRPPRDSGTPYEILLWVHGISHFFVIGSFFVFAFQQNEINLWLVTAAISTGLCSGASAIVTAHELGHHRPRSPGWILARLLLFTVNYSHFTTEHNHVHHKWVATDRDSASARSDEGIWFFWVRTIPGQFFSSLQVHNRKGRRGIRNPTLQYFSLQIFAGLVLLSFSNGIVLLSGWLILSLLAILTLEYVNYIRHWGLRRDVGERQSMMHRSGIASSGRFAFRLGCAGITGGDL